MKLTVVRLIFLVTAIAPAYSQTVLQPGNATDLRDVVAIHVATNNPVTRELITKQIKRRLPQIRIVEDPQAAQVWLAFKTERESFFKSPESELTATRTIPVDTRVVGRGEILKATPKGSPKRVGRFDNYSDDEKSLAQKFADEFIKLYRRANRK